MRIKNSKFNPNKKEKRKESALQNRTTVNTSFSVLISVKPTKSSVTHRKYRIGILDSVCFYFHKNKRTNVYITLCKKVVKEALSVINFINYERIEKIIKVNQELLFNNFVKMDSGIVKSDFASDGNIEGYKKDVKEKK